MSNPYEIYWNADYAGKVGIYDVYREALSLGMYRDLADQTNLERNGRGGHQYGEGST